MIWKSRALVAVAAVTPLCVVTLTTPSTAAGRPSHAASSHITVTRAGSSAALASSSPGELSPTPDLEHTDVGKAVQNRSPRSNAKATRGTVGPSGVLATATPAVTTASSGFEGLNQYKQRTSDGGNQWTVSPPDQALCAGGGQVLEGVNNAFQVYDASTQQPLSGVVSANQLLWGDHEINRTTSVGSPHQIGDPGCVYDAGTNRFYVSEYDIDSTASGASTGRFYLDVAVSPVGTALGTWTTWRIDVTDDGTNGTPSHAGCPCFGDFPHLATDANGLYITTNEFPWSTAGFDWSQVYAISKAGLTSGAATLSATQFDTSGMDTLDGTQVGGYSLSPAVSNGTSYAPNRMYFLSSDADTVGTSSRQIVLWTLTNTASIDTDPGSMELTDAIVPTQLYADAPPTDQRAGSTPLADCLNVTACSKVLLGKVDKFKEFESSYDSNDARMAQSAYADGLVWGALTTGVDIGGTTKAGTAYFVVDPTSASLVKQGVVAVAGNNLTYPAIGVTPAGHAVVGVSLGGGDYYPSAAYFRIDASPTTGTSGISVVGAGAGPWDDFTAYRAYAYNRPRFGDYGAAAVVGDTVWIANEYIAQSCSLAAFQQAPVGTCGGTRTALANWSTHIAAVPAS